MRIWLLRLVRQGAQDYLVKGQITSNLLIRTLRYSIERKQMERQLSLYTQELEARNRELDAYSYTIAHDLQNPIASLIIYTHMIRSAIKDTDDAKLLNRIDKLETIIEKMSSMINQLLHLARLRNPASGVTSVDMVKMARASIKRFEIQIADKNIKIVLDENLPPALGHPA
jgi:two-component system, sensor histidine kinase and response regulator